MRYLLLSKLLSIAKNQTYKTVLLSQRMTLSVVILPAKVLADGTHKIRIAFAHNGQTRYYNTRFIVPSTDCLKNGVIVKVGNASYINQQLRTLQNKLYKAYDEIEDAEYYTCSQLLNLIKNKLEHARAHTFEEIAKEWLEMKKAKCSSSSILTYERGVYTFGQFAGKNYLLSTLTSKTLYDYDRWLSKTLNGTTINIRIGTLRDIINYSTKHKYVSFDLDPFEDYKGHPNVVRKCELPVAVLRKLRDLKSDNATIILCRDMIMLSFYLAGMNGADIFNTDLTGDIVCYSRQKTKNRRKNVTQTSFVIQPEARTIIDKYICKDGKVRFDKIDNKSKMSVYISTYANKIADLIGYNGHLMYYSARKTFSQLANLLGIQESVILYCLGDSYANTNNSMLGYYTFVDKKMADSAIRKVLDFVASDKTEDDLFKLS